MWVHKRLERVIFPIAIDRLRVSTRPEPEPDERSRVFMTLQRTPLCAFSEHGRFHTAWTLSRSVLRDHIDRRFYSELPLTRQRAIGSRQTGRLELVVRTPTFVRDLPAAGPLGHRHR
jgi:hypothetical protein